MLLLTIFLLAFLGLIQNIIFTGPNLMSRKQEVSKSDAPVDKLVYFLTEFVEYAKQDKLISDPSPLHVYTTKTTAQVTLHDVSHNLQVVLIATHRGQNTSLPVDIQIPAEQSSETRLIWMMKMWRNNFIGPKHRAIPKDILLQIKLTLLHVTPKNESSSEP